MTVTVYTATMNRHAFYFAEERTARNFIVNNVQAGTAPTATLHGPATSVAKGPLIGEYSVTGWEWVIPA